MLASTLLLHRTPRGRHYDWLIAPLATLTEPCPLLWTARVDRPWEDWSSLGRVMLTPLPPHRRRYLTWQGVLPPAADAVPRGSVTRHGTALVTPRLWTPHRLLLRLETAGFALSVQVETPPGAPRWFATVLR